MCPCYNIKAPYLIFGYGAFVLSLCTVDKCLQDFAAVGIFAEGKFRMPLDSPDKVLFRQIYGFHQPIRGDSHRLQPGRQGADRLVMAAVDIDLFCVQQSLQRCAVQQVDCVAGHIVRGLLPVGDHIGFF